MNSTTAHGLADLKWKHDWATARLHHEQWWRGEGLVLWINAPKDTPWENVPQPTAPAEASDRWLDADWRVARDEYNLSRQCFAGDAFPYMSTWSGAGDLAAYLGCPTDCDERTVWFEPIIHDDSPPEDFPPLKIDCDNIVLRKTLAIIDKAIERSAGRYLVSQPDIVENVDILASLRGTEPLLMDMIERPEWIEERLWQINEAFFEAFDIFYHRIADAYGGNTFVFNLWGPGRTAKVQCDACSMFGPEMFRRFVVPPLKAQCDWLDFAMFHLDGEDCIPNLDALLEIDSLQAIEWTPRFLSVGDSGGNPKWFDMYRRILSAGKSVQAIGVKHEEIIPMLDALGGKGMFITASAPDEQAAHDLAERAKAYR